MVFNNKRLPRISKRCVAVNAPTSAALVLHEFLSFSVTDTRRIVLRFSMLSMCFVSIFATQIFRINDKTLLGLSGLVTDMQTLYVHYERIQSLLPLHLCPCIVFYFLTICCIRLPLFSMGAC